MSEKIEVTAKFVNNYQFGFECPFCFTKYKMNGDPYKNAKRVIHVHGSEGILENRKTVREAHCNKDSNKRIFIINITDETVRN
jgi:hypothetical protein